MRVAQLDAPGSLVFHRIPFIAVLAYSPLAQGLLTGKCGVDRILPEDDWRCKDPRFSEESRKRITAFLEEIRPIANAHDATLGQLTIAWTLAQPGLTHALVGARNPQQVLENVQAADIVLTEQEMTAIAGALSRLEISN